ncbi:transcriptional regulator [Herbidospora galbida]|uniref:Transcriptional regulator n=2 Tax=Herbidospora galbida TaxID=2575442 RepID=A0A4U3MB63_9ACTN|nr:transcriptional regulator [Herbidospora galbida]
MSIVAVLAAADQVEFQFVRDAVEVTDPTLSKQVTTLEKAGYVEVVKGYLGKRPRTWLKLTPEGRAAFTRHLAALKAIADGAGMA